MKILTGDDLPLPPRKKDSHKGDFGHVLLVGGGPGMPGAIGLAALAALRSGAGAVTIATRPEYAHGAFLSLIPEAMVYGINNSADLQPLIKRATICVLGPGLGDSPWAEMLFSSLLPSLLPMIIDASALGFLAKKPQKKDNWILTPHPGEAAHLLKTRPANIQQDRLIAAMHIQQLYGGVTVLKGSNTLIQTSAGETFVCPRGNPGMSTAGMGDVLTGIIAGLAAQGLSLEKAARLGVWLQASAGDRLAGTQGEAGMLARDLIPLLPPILNGLLS